MCPCEVTSLQTIFFYCLFINDKSQLHFPMDSIIFINNNTKEKKNVLAHIDVFNICHNRAWKPL